MHFFRLQDDLRRKFVKSSFDDRRLYTERPRRLLRDAILMLSKVCWLPSRERSILPTWVLPPPPPRTPWASSSSPSPASGCLAWCNFNVFQGMLIAGDPRTHRTCPTIMQRRQLLARQTELDSMMLATFGLLRTMQRTQPLLRCSLSWRKQFCVLSPGLKMRERESVPSLWRCVVYPTHRYCSPGADESHRGWGSLLRRLCAQ